MITHTADFKEKIKEFGREIDAKVIRDSETLTSEELNSLKPRFNTELFKTIMKEVEFDSNIKLEHLKWVNPQFGLKVSDEYEWLDYGDYYISNEPEFNADTNSYIHIGYDKMIESMVYYDEDPLSVEFPISYKNYLIAFCNKLGWDYEFPEEFPNMDTMIEEDLYGGLGLTYRDILDDLCPASMGNFANAGVFRIIYPTETGDVIDDEYLKEDNITIGKKVGPINALVLSRAEDGDTINRRDEDSIMENELQELKIKDNILLSSSFRENFIDEMFDKIKGFEYYVIDVASTGVLYYEPLDKFTIRHEGIGYPTIALNSEVNIEDGLEELLYTPALDESVTDYTTSSTTDKGIKNAIIQAKKNKAEIDLLVYQQTEQSTQMAQITQTVDEITATVQKVGGNNLIKNSAMKNGTNFWFAHLLAPYIESDTPPAEDLHEGAYWYCSSNYEDYQLGIIYKYESGNWIETTLTRKYIDDAQNLLKYTTQYENEYTRQNTLSNSIIKQDGGTSLDVSHIFTCTNPIDIIKGQEYITLSFKLKNSMITGVGYIVLGFTEKYIDNAMAEILYSLYEPCYWFTPDDTRELTEIVLTVKVPQKGDFIEATAGLTAPTTDKMWIDLNTHQLKEYNEETELWERKQTILPCYETTTRQIWAYRQLFDIYYETPVNFDNFEIKCVYPAFTMYPEFMRLIPSDVPPTPFKGAYWLNVVENVYRAKYNGDEFVEWEDTGISTEYIFNNPFPTPPFPTPYGVPLQGYYEVADIKAEWNKIATEWSGYLGEIYGKNVKIDEKGMKIISGQNTMFIDEDEIIAKFNDEAIFIISKDLVQFRKMLLLQQVQIGSFVQESRMINNVENFLLY